MNRVLVISSIALALLGGWLLMSSPTADVGTDPQTQSGEPESPVMSREPQPNEPLDGESEPAEESETVPVEESVTTSAQEVETDPEYDSVSPSAAPEGFEATWTADVASAVGDGALRAVRAYGATDLQANAWWKNLAPLLTDRGQFVYESVDPGRIPVMDVGGVVAVREGASPLIAEADVETSQGTYTVLMVRTDGSGAWLAEKILPPETR